MFNFFSKKKNINPPSSNDIQSVDFSEVFYIPKDYSVNILNDLPIDDDKKKNINENMKFVQYYFKRNQDVNGQSYIELSIEYKKSLSADDDIQYLKFDIFNNNNKCPLFEYIQDTQYGLIYDDQHLHHIPDYIKDLGKIQNQDNDNEDKNIFLYRLFKKIHMENKLQQMKRTNISIQDLNEP